MIHHLLSLMVFLPLAGAALQAFRLPRWVAFGFSVAGSLCAIAAVASMQGSTPEPQGVETISWIGSYAISYEVALDGLNALLVLLVAIVLPVLIAAEWNQKLGARGMHGLFLVLQSAFFGALCAQDVFLQFFFWGLTALPFYFLIGIWGGKGRETAAFRSIVAAALGNGLVFAALILIYYSVDPHSFLLKDLVGGKLVGKTFDLFGHEMSMPVAALALIGAGLALRTPIWPFHGWFTQVAGEAPATIFVALAGVSVPVSAYIFVRLCYSLFPETMASAAELVVVVGVINLLVGGVCALAQRELKLLLAYVCLSGLGLVLIGAGSLSASGVVGAVYQQLVLGLGVTGFGLLAGLLAERAGHSVFLPESGQNGGKRDFGGVAMKAPAAALFGGVVVASLLAFPGSGGFVSSALIMVGSYSAHPATVGLAVLAFLLATYYLFSMYRNVFLGEPGGEVESFTDLTLRERAYLLPLAAGILMAGIYPRPLLELVRPTVQTLLSTIK